MAAKKQPEKWQARLGTNALNPLQVMDLQEAVKSKKKRVQMQGRWFELKYKEDGETVWYSPEDEFYAPCGYLNIPKLLRSF